MSSARRVGINVIRRWNQALRRQALVQSPTYIKARYRRIISYDRALEARRIARSNFSPVDVDLLSWLDVGRIDHNTDTVIIPPVAKRAKGGILAVIKKALTKRLFGGKQKSKAKQIANSGQKSTSFHVSPVGLVVTHTASIIPQLLKKRSKNG